jgi:serine O-acetyltransferase
MSDRKQAIRALMARHPGFFAAVEADTRFIAPKFGRPLPEDAGKLRVALETLRLAWDSEAYLAQIAFRGQAALRRRGVPVLPRLLHQFSIIWAQVLITDTVIMKPGVNIPRGLVMIGGFTEIGPRATISPSVTLGLTADGGFDGPKIGAGAQIGTGVRILGPVTIGANARIGANSVVLHDVPDGATAVGSPARIISRAEDEPGASARMVGADG